MSEAAEGALPSRGTPEASRPEGPLGLWEAYGVEIEMMIVDRERLDVRPVADRLMARAAGEEGACDVSRGPIAWSNELALHVLELKTDGPAAELEGLAELFQANVAEASALLGELGCRLMPGGMHPWMDPERDLRLWPHEYTEVYRTFDRIFGCRGHGWANLQSTHLNLPFRDDAELARLHEAVRLLLPLVPALAASSPVREGRAGGALDLRLLAYRDNARRVPSVTGRVVPERVASRAAYERDILERIYRDLEPLDPEGVLRHEWVNARGAIARFDRGSLEIRVVDAQECPRADLAVLAALVAVLRRLVDGPLAAGVEPHVDEDALVELLDRTVRLGGEARIEDGRYLELFGLDASGAGARTAGEVWQASIGGAGLLEPGGPWAVPLRTILERGTLAERLRVALGLRRTPGDIRGRGRGESTDLPGEAALPGEELGAVYRRLCDCLVEGRIFGGDG